jgi:hypothetical protein
VGPVGPVGLWGCGAVGLGLWGCGLPLLRLPPHPPPPEGALAGGRLGLLVRGMVTEAREADHAAAQRCDDAGDRTSLITVFNFCRHNDSFCTR